MGLDQNTMKMITQAIGFAKVAGTGYSTAKGISHNKRISEIEKESLAIEKEAETQKLEFQEEDLNEQARRSRKSLLAAASASGLMPAAGGSTEALIKAGGKNLQRDIGRLDNRRSLLNKGFRLKREAADLRYQKASNELLASGFGSLFTDIGSMFVKNKLGSSFFDGGFFPKKSKTTLSGAGNSSYFDSDN